MVLQTVANGDTITLDIKGAIGVVGLVAMIVTYYFKWKDKQDSYTKSAKETREAETAILREYAEKFHMLKMEVLGSNAVDGDVLIAKVNREWEEMKYSKKK